MRSLEEIKRANELAMGGDRAQQVKIEDAIAAAVIFGFGAGLRSESNKLSVGARMTEAGNAVGKALENARKSLGFAPPSGS